jgi:hypothetical protein
MRRSKPSVRTHGSLAAWLGDGTLNEPTPTDTVCLVTIHGIGFQQAPDDASGLAGYADPLHEALSALLGDALSDDPHRAEYRTSAGQCGAIYVQSSWPTGQGHSLQRSTEKGLERLGSRRDPCDPHVDIAGKDLFAGCARIAHIALVYTPLEVPTDSDRGALLETATLGLLHLENYSSLHGELFRLGKDIVTLIHEPPVSGEPVMGNIPRQDVVHHTTVFRRVMEHVHGGGSSRQAGPFEVLRDVEDDAAAYVARNELRERTRDFVREVLIRLAQRGDVTRIVVNAHSQGSILAFDTLRTLPCEVIDRVAAFFTLGTPLRKAVASLGWGQDVGQLRALQGWRHSEGSVWGRSGSETTSFAWTNLWDRLDPVADPLAPDLTWTRDQKLEPATHPGLFQDVDPQTGATSDHPVEDCIVDNVHHVPGGGLRAHDYWDNREEVVPRIADRLRHLVAPDPAISTTPAAPDNRVEP